MFSYTKELLLGCTREPCKEGYKYIFPNCYQNCNPGWKDQGLLCRGKNSKGQWATRTKHSYKPSCRSDPVVVQEEVEEVDTPTAPEEEEELTAAESRASLQTKGNEGEKTIAKKSVQQQQQQADDPPSIIFGEPSNPDAYVDVDVEVKSLPQVQNPTMGSGDISVVTVVGVFLVSYIALKIWSKRKPS